MLLKKMHFQQNATQYKAYLSMVNVFFLELQYEILEFWSLCGPVKYLILQWVPNKLKGLDIPGLE